MDNKPQGHIYFIKHDDERNFMRDRGKILKLVQQLSSTEVTSGLLIPEKNTELHVIIFNNKYIFTLKRYI